MKAIDVQEKLGMIQDHWNPRIVAELNGQFVKLAKVKGEFIWHKHDGEDELFYVLKGTLRILFRDREVMLKPGSFCVVPKGVEHKPVADEEVHLMLFEPVATHHTGGEASQLRKDELEWI